MEKSQDIWKEQCVAAHSVRAQYGILPALDYLIGEKLLPYAEMAVTRPEFARELPRFVAEVRNIFGGDDIRHYLDHLERMAAMEDEQFAIGCQRDSKMWERPGRGTLNFCTVCLKLAAVAGASNHAGFGLPLGYAAKMRAHRGHRVEAFRHAHYVHLLILQKRYRVDRIKIGIAGPECW